MDGLKEGGWMGWKSVLEREKEEEEESVGEEEKDESVGGGDRCPE